MNGMEQVNALLGTKESRAGGAGEDYKSKYEDAMRQLQSARVEQGRVKNLDAKNKELEREIERLRGDRGAARIAAELSPEDKGDMPDDYVGVMAKIASRAANGAADATLTGMNEQIAQLRAEREAEKEANRRRMAEEFVGRINRRFPGFLASIGDGGDKANAWNSFLVNNSASVQAAVSNCEYDQLVYHIERFYREVLDIRPPKAGDGEAAAPDPKSHGSGSPSVKREDSNKTYAAEEYAALDEKCMKLRREGKFEEYRKLRDELDSALSEGRVQD